MNKLLSDPEKRSPPKCEILPNPIEECIVFDCSNENLRENLIKKHDKNVIIDLKCAQAVLRGADVFLPGIIGLTPSKII